MKKGQETTRTHCSLSLTALAEESLYYPKGTGEPCKSSLGIRKAKIKLGENLSAV